MYSAISSVVSYRFKERVVLVDGVPCTVRSAGLEETMAAAKAIVRSSGSFRWDCAIFSAQEKGWGAR
jgi:hypothetical protein